MKQNLLQMSKEEEMEVQSDDKTYITSNRIQQSPQSFKEITELSSETK